MATRPAQRKRIRMRPFGYATMRQPLCTICPKEGRHVSQITVGEDNMCFSHYAKYLAAERKRIHGSSKFIIGKKK